MSLLHMRRQRLSIVDKTKKQISRQKPPVCLFTCKGENYGSALQATSLYDSIAELGYDVSFLGQFFVLSYMLLHPSLFLIACLRLLNRRKSNRFFKTVPYEITEERRHRLQEYDKKHFHMLWITNSRIWKETIQKGTIFVVGSDILWQPNGGPPGKAFLDFAYYTDLKKFSYATSIGAKELPKKYYHWYRKYLGAFSCISVREEGAAKLMGAVINRKIETVLDPTLLHNPSYWDLFAGQAVIPAEIVPTNYIFCYFVMDDPRYWEYIKIVKETTKLPVVVLPMHYRDEKEPYILLTEGTPNEFVWLLKNAALVCTDSFHACAFSLNYQKEFYLLRRMRKDEDDKYDDFLSRYSLTERIVKDEKNFVRKPQIDYTVAYEQLQADREKSQRFLQEALAR